MSSSSQQLTTPAPTGGAMAKPTAPPASSHGGHVRHGGMGYGGMGYGGMGYGGMGYGGMGMGMSRYGMMGGYGMMGRYGMMGAAGAGGVNEGMMGVLGKIEMVSMSVGLLGQGVQMLGMNAEMIHNAFAMIIQLLDRLTYSLAELTGCTPPSMYKIEIGPQGEETFVPLTAEEVEAERALKAKRRRTARWVIAMGTAAVLYWRLKRQRQAAGAAMAREFQNRAAPPHPPHPPVQPGMPPAPTAGVSTGRYPPPTQQHVRSLPPPPPAVSRAPRPVPAAADVAAAATLGSAWEGQ